MAFVSLVGYLVVAFLKIVKLCKALPEVAGISFLTQKTGWVI